jgi:hypothetical protein
MLTFTVNNEALIVGTDASVRFTWYNPAFNTEEFPGDVGLNISIPVNDRNRMLLGNPGRFERYTTGIKREFENFEIRYSGVLLMAGTFIMQSANKEQYSGWLRSSIGNIGKEHREKNIYDSISFNQDKSFVNKANYDPDTDEYACPKIFNPDFFKDKGEKTTVERKVLNPNYSPFWGGVTFWTSKDNHKFIYESEEVEDLTEAHRRTAAWFVNAQNEDGTILNPDSFTAANAFSIAKYLEVAPISPMLFLNYVLKTIFKDAGYYLDNNFLADNADLKKLIIYNNFDITNITYADDGSMIWQVYDWHDGDANVDFHKAIGMKVKNVYRNTNGKFYYKTLLPKINLKNFLLGTGNLLNVFTFFRPGRKITDIIDRETILSGTYIDIEKFITGFWEIGEEINSTLKFTFEHDSNDMQFQEKWVNIDDYRDNEREAVDTWDDLESISNPVMGEIRHIKDQNIYVQYKLWVNEVVDQVSGDTTEEKFVGWGHLARGFQNGYYNYGKETEKKIDTKFSTIAGEQTAVVSQKGNIRSELFTYENFSPRLMFYLGNNQARYETDNVALDWEKENKGLLTQRWPRWSRFLSTCLPVSCEANFPMYALDHVIKNIYSKFRAKEGEFLIESIETEFRINEIGTTSIKGYKSNYSPKEISLTESWYLNDIIWIDQPFGSDGMEQFYPLILNGLSF